MANSSRSSQSKRQSAASRAPQASNTSSSKPTSRTPRNSKPFEIDDDLLSDTYNQVREPVLPYGFIVNDNPAGIFIPLDQLEAAGWVSLAEEELSTVSPTEQEVQGLLLTEARMIILGYTPEYIRYKRNEEETSGTIIGRYSDHQYEFDKKTMDVCADHALVFLDDSNQPLHTTAIRVRFKNVAYWSFKPEREAFYRQLERTFAEFIQQRYSGKTDRWRSLGVVEISFKAEKEGTGKNKSWCCKTAAITSPTVETLPRLFLGTAALKTTVWTFHDTIAGFGESLALPTAADSATLSSLPGEATPKQLKSATLIDDEDETFDMADADFVEVEAEASDDFDFDDDLED